MNFFGSLSANPIPPAKTAVLYKGKSFGYQELFNKSSTSAVLLQNKGIRQNDKVALLGENTPDFIITVLAIWKLKAIPVALNNRLLINELEQQINFSGCSFLIYDDHLKNTADHIRVSSSSFSDISTNNDLIGDDYQLNVETSQTALILFTSGSTGKPKAVILSFKNLIKSAEIGNQIFKNEEKDIWLAALPFYHIGGFSIITRTFLYGLTLVIPESISTAGIIKSLKEYNPTLTSFVTTQLKRMLDNNIKPNPGLKHILLGGGFIEPTLVQQALNAGWNVSTSYGSTETSSFVTALTKGNFVLRPGSAGIALFPNKILIMDEHKNILPSNTSGEVVIESDAVAAGYFNNSEETSKKFSGNIFYSGDFGYLDDSGFLYIQARRSDLIISGGENINPLEVERTLLTHPDIIEACVLGLEDKDWGHSVTAVLITRNNTQLTIEEVKSFLKDKLPSYKYPQKLFILNELPKTSLGKVQKEKLKEIIKKTAQTL